MGKYASNRSVFATAVRQGVIGQRRPIWARHCSDLPTGLQPLPMQITPPINEPWQTSTNWPRI